MILTRSFCDRTLAMQIVIHHCRILLLKGENAQCVSRGMEALTSMGHLSLPPILENPELVASYEMDLWNQILDACREHGFAKYFATLPVLKDDYLLAINSVLVEITAPAAYAAPHLVHTMPLVGISLAFQYGNCLQTAFHVLTSSLLLTFS